MAYTPKAVQRLYKRFNGQELRHKPDQGSIKIPCQPSPKTRGFPGTYRSVCLPLLAILIHPIYNNTPRLTGSLALSVAYGIQAETVGNEYLRLYREMIRSLGQAAVPGAFVVDILSPCEFNPSSMGYGEH